MRRLQVEQKHQEGVAWFLLIQPKVRGGPPPQELIVVDGKKPKHGPEAVLSAVSVPSQFHLGSALVATKTNEIPVARQLFGSWNLRGGGWRWTPCTPRTTRRATWCWSTGPIIR